MLRLIPSVRTVCVTRIGSAAQLPIGKAIRPVNASDTRR